MPLYENEFRFYGYHKDCVNALRVNRVFRSAIDMFYVAAMIGFLNGHRAKEEKDDSTTTDIQTNQFFNTTNNEQLTFAFQSILLCDEEFEPNETKRINALFRDTTLDTRYRKRFEEYVRGGLEILYQEIIEDTDNDEVLIACRLCDFVNQIDTFQKSIKVKSVTDACKAFYDSK